MALTNYLTQTIMGLTILGAMIGVGELGRAEILVFILIVWAVQLAWSSRGSNASASVRSSGYGGGDLPEAAADPPLTGGAVSLRTVAAAGRPLPRSPPWPTRHLSRRQLRPDLRGDHGDRARRYRHDPRRARRAPDPQRPQPDRRWSPDAHWFTGTGMVHGVRLRQEEPTGIATAIIVSDRVAEATGRPITPGPRFPTRGHRQHQRDRPRQ